MVTSTVTQSSMNYGTLKGGNNAIAPPKEDYLPWSTIASNLQAWFVRYYKVGHSPGQQEGRGHVDPI